MRIEKVKNKAGLELDALVLTGLDKVEEPESLRLLRHRVARRQPLVDLPELLLEIQVRTGFASEFLHISEARSRLDDLPTSICAVLLAEACNAMVLDDKWSRNMTCGWGSFPSHTPAEAFLSGGLPSVA